MNRRSFLTAAAAAPLAACTLTIESEDDRELTITPESYRTNPGHKELADRVMASAGVNPDECTEITVTAALAVLSVFRYTAGGKRFIDGEQVAVRLIRHPGSFLPRRMEGL
jgi:hypothetical protein